MKVNDSEILLIDFDFKSVKHVLGPAVKWYK